MFQKTEDISEQDIKNTPRVGISQVGKGSHAACYRSVTKGTVPLVENWLYGLTDVPTSRVTPAVALYRQERALYNSVLASYKLLE